MARRRGLVVVPALTAAAWLLYAVTPGGGALRARVAEVAARGDGATVIALVPIVAFFVHLALSEARCHDRLIRAGRGDEILRAMQE